MSSLSSSHAKAYRPDVDGLRAIAILPVLLFHLELGCTGGFVGVDVFFVISGYLIASIIWRDLQKGTFTLGDFWARRVRRILPALFVVQVVALAVGWWLFIPTDYVSLGKSVMAACVMLANVFFFRQTGYFESPPDSRPLLHLWSLAVEEQYYLLFPVGLAILVKARHWPVRHVLAGLMLASFGLNVWLTHRHSDAAFYLLPTRAWELLMGAWLAVRAGERPPVSKASAGASSARWLGWLGLGLILAAVGWYDAGTRFPGIAALWPCLGAGLIIYAGAYAPAARWSVTRLLSWKPLVGLGLISYSLYLWHWPVIVFYRYSQIDAPGTLEKLALLGLALLLAVASWRWIEQPFRRPPAQTVRARSWRVVAQGALLLAALFVLGAGVYLGAGLPQRFSAEAQRFLSWGGIKFRGVSLEQVRLGKWEELAPASTGDPVRVVIWADSHGSAVAPALEALCKKYSVRGCLVGQPGVPPLKGYHGHTIVPGLSVAQRCPTFHP